MGRKAAPLDNPPPDTRQQRLHPPRRSRTQRPQPRRRSRNTTGLPAAPCRNPQMVRHCVLVRCRRRIGSGVRAARLGQRGGATRNHNKDSYAICLIGDTTKQQISQAAIDAIRELIAHGISSNKISAPTFQIRGHRDVKATSCPGESAYAVLSQMYPGQGGSPDEPAAIPVLKPPPYVKALRLRRPRMRGYAVKWVQAAVGATPIDGIFGPGTKKKVVAWQRANGLVADGVAGRRSWKVMFGAG